MCQQHPKVQGDSKARTLAVKLAQEAITGTTGGSGELRVLPELDEYYHTVLAVLVRPCGVRSRVCFNVMGQVASESLRQL